MTDLPRGISPSDLAHITGVVPREYRPAYGDWEPFDGETTGFDSMNDTADRDGEVTCCDAAREVASGQESA